MNVLHRVWFIDHVEATHCELHSVRIRFVIIPYQLFLNCKLNQHVFSASFMCSRKNYWHLNIG